MPVWAPTHPRQSGSSQAGSITQEPTAPHHPVEPQPDEAVTAGPACSVEQPQLGPAGSTVTVTLSQDDARIVVALADALAEGRMGRARTLTAGAIATLLTDSLLGNVWSDRQVGRCLDLLGVEASRRYRRHIQEIREAVAATLPDAQAVLSAEQAFELIGAPAFDLSARFPKSGG